LSRCRKQPAQCAGRRKGKARWRAALGAHVSLFAALGGVPKFVVCDNLKSAVARVDRYEPGLNRSYLELAEHYGTTLLPARPGKPCDKAKAEQSVLLAGRLGAVPQAWPGCGTPAFSRWPS
jgi:transposase